MRAIVFIHTGSPAYLAYSIRQAVSLSDSTTPVFLIGDGSNAGFCDRVTHIAIAPLLAKAKTTFRNYVHMSSNSEAFEYFCILRWFILYFFCLEYHISEVFLCDSDLLLFSCFGELKELIGNAEIAISIPSRQDDYRWTACPHLTYITMETLRSVCLFINDMYASSGLRDLTRKYDWHKQTGTNGGVCDMTLLYLYSRQQIPGSVFNLAVSTNDVAVDFRMNIADNFFDNEYEMSWFGLKRLRWSKGIPYAVATGGTLTRFMALHFGGSSKMYLPLYYSHPLTAPLFAGQLRHLKKAIRHQLRRVVGRCS